VRGRVLPEERHARIPGFAQGREGIVETVNEAFPFPDSNRRGEGENPEHVYTVVFAAGDLWGSTEARSTVSVDLWESYLEPA
jgi:nitrile hydratase